LEAARLIEAAGRYVQAWNEPDPRQRRAFLSSLYAPDGYLVTQSKELQGIETIIGHVAEVNSEFIATRRYEFRCGGAMAHHDCVLFRWEMVDAQSSELADAGMNLLLLDADGRIQRDLQFVLGTDSSIGHLAVAP